MVTSGSLFGPEHAFRQEARNLPSLYTGDLDLVFFSVRTIGCNAVLKWPAYGRASRDRLAVERCSYLSGWKVVAGSGHARIDESAMVCEFMDRALMPGVQYFYRLRLRTNDGRTRYSRVESIHIDSDVGLGIRLFPNPVRTDGHLHIDGLDSATGTIKLVPFGGGPALMLPIGGQCCVDLSEYRLRPGGYRVEYTDELHQGYSKIVVFE